MSPIKPSYNCTLELAMDLVGGKWKMPLLWLLRDEAIRFGELRRLLGCISEKVLAEQLKELEEAGLVLRKAYPQVPPKVEYSLTEEGRKLSPILDSLCEWSSAYAGNNEIPCKDAIATARMRNRKVS